jgi:stage III sporulation protein AD
MDVFVIAAAAVVTAALAILLKQHRPELAMLLTLAGSVLILLIILSKAAPFVDTLGRFLDGTGLPGEYGAIIFKSLGICFLTQLAADTCKDAGETALASKMELGGKIAVLLLALPLFEKVISLAGGLIGS